MHLLKKIITTLTLSFFAHGVSQASVESVQAFDLAATSNYTPHLIFKTPEEMADIVLKPYASMEDIYQLTIMYLALEEGQLDIAGPLALGLAKSMRSVPLAKMTSAIYAVSEGDAAAALEAAALWRELDGDNEEAHVNYLIVAARAGDYDGLTEELRRRLTLGIYPPEIALAEVAEFLRRLNQPEQALSIFQELVADQDAVPTSLVSMLLSDFAMYADKQQMAWDHALKALKDERLSVEVRSMAAMRILQLAEGGRSFQAYQLVSQFIAANPHQRAVRLFYVHRLTVDGSYDLALDELKRMSESYPEDFDLLYYRAQVEYQAGRLDEAVAQLEQYLSVQKQVREAVPDEQTTAQASVSDAYFLMAKIYEDLKNYRKALEVLAQIDEPSVRNDLLIEQASLYIKLKEFTQAHALLEQIQPDDDEDAYVRALMMNASLSRDRGEYDQGLDYLERAMRYYPDNLYIRYSQAMMLEAQGDIDGAIEILELILQDYPEESESYNGLGYVLADNNRRLEESLELIERALAMSPDSIHIQDSYGWVNFRLGNLELALAYLEMAWAGEPLAEIAAHLADVHYALGDREKAYEYLQKGYELDAIDRALVATMEHLGYEPQLPEESEGTEESADDEALD